MKANTLKQKKHRADKGELLVSFELLELYEKGDNDTSPSQYYSEKYYNQCLELLSWNLGESQGEEPKNKFKINELKLLNYKRFNDLKIAFDQNITVIIGDNGSGKTSILDALSKLFSWINARIIKEKRNGRSLDDNDVSVNSEDFCELIAKFEYGKNIISGSLVRANKKGLSSIKSSSLDTFEAYSNSIRIINARERNLENNGLNIPLLASYTVERSSLKSNYSFDLEKLNITFDDDRLEALENRTVLDGTGNISDFLQWFVSLDLRCEYGTPETSELNKIEAEIEILSGIINEQDEKAWKHLQNRISERDNILKTLKNDNSSPSRSREIIKSAIIKCHPSINDIFVDKTSGRAEVKVNNDGVIINILQMSKGQQVYFSLIADISKRLLLLNPRLSNPLNGQGIILIDEVELHLHPEWQKGIINNLTNAFPNIQFILTTHSPQVLTTISRNNIRTITENISGEIIASIPLAESYARTNSETLYTIMKVDPKPDFVERKLLKKYEKIIEQGDINSKEAHLLEQELTNKLGSDHEDLIRLSLIKRKRERLG